MSSIAARHDALMAIAGQVNDSLAEPMEEPPDRKMVLLAHPDGAPERVFYRDDAASEESGYGEDDDGTPTGQRWYEVVQFPEAPVTWATLLEEQDGCPIFVLERATPTPGWPAPWVLKPTDGQPEDESDEDGLSVGWDLSSGCKLSIGEDRANHPDDPPLTIQQHFSDADLARGFVKRQVTPDQAEQFAIELIALARSYRHTQTRRR